MIKKVLAAISTFLMCITMLIGCGKSDPVQEDLINYINNEKPTLVEYENKVTTEYTACTTQFPVDNVTLAAKLKDTVIPATEELLTKAKAITPATEEVNKLHAKYIAVVTEQLEGFNLLLEAAQNSDKTLVATVDEKLTHADTVSKEYLADMDALKKKHNIIGK